MSLADWINYAEALGHNVFFLSVFVILIVVTWRLIGRLALASATVAWAVGGTIGLIAKAGLSVVLAGLITLFLFHAF